MNTNVMATLPFIDLNEIVCKKSLFSLEIKTETRENRMIDEAYRQEWERRIKVAKTQEEQVKVCDDIEKEKKRAKRNIAEERKRRREESIRNEVNF